MKRLLFLPLFAVLSLAIFGACGGDDDDAAPSGDSKPASAASATVDPNVYARPELLVQTTELAKLAADPKVVIVDVRKKELYDAGHVPGAVWYDSAKLKDPDDKFFVVRPQLFAEAVGALGITTDKKVVVYDAGNGLSATHFWWVMWYYGNEGSVVNGGFAKYEKDGLPVTKDAPVVTKVSFTPKVNEDVICAIDYVAEQSEKKDPNVVIIDARSAAEYTGADVRAAKGGHVPNAVNLDWALNMTTTEPKVWKSAPELRAQFQKVGIKQDTKVVAYCQIGVRAAHSIFTLRLLGFEELKNYDGSWQEWGNSKDTKTAN
jgi:thiosulfate/3-mercaptopyruvate sulfurtransferase